MKIAFISAYAGIIDGGVERHTHRIAKELAKKNKVTIITIDRYEGKNYHNQKIDNVNYVRLPVKYNLSYRIKVWPALYKELMKGYDIIQGFGHGHMYFSDVVKAAKKTNAKLFYTIYGPATEEAEYSLYEKILIKLIGLINDNKIKECDKIFLRNPVFAKEWLKSLGVEDKKIFLDIGAVEKEYFSSKKAKEKKNTIFYNGRISPQKGLQTLIDCMKDITKEIPEAKLIITGQDQNKYEKEMKEKIKSLELEKNIKFLGKISEKELIKLFDEATVFALPSTYEGLGQSLIKAMARGKACIAMNKGAVPWVLENGKCGLLAENKEDMTKKIIYLLNNEKIRNSLGRKAKERAKIFIYENSLKKIIKEYS